MNSSYSPEEIEAFLNALQLCIKSEIKGYHGDDREHISLHFSKKPSKDEGWSYFEKITEGDWKNLHPQPLESYFIRNPQNFINPTFINFLRVTRLKKETMMEVAKTNPHYRNYLEKILDYRDIPVKTDDAQEIVKLIFKELEKKKITIRELAHQSGLSMVSISNFKAGKDIRLSNFLKILSVLGIKMKLE